MPLLQNYNPKEFEDKIYDKWIKNSVGNVEKQQLVQGLNESSPTHSILMPPPNLTGNMHAGHAFQHYIMDTLSRINRQNGNLNLWFPGVDHAGIQLEGVIDKLIKKGEFDESIKIKSEKLKVKNETVEEILQSIETKNRDDLPKLIKKNLPELWTELAWSKVNLWRNNQQNQAKVLGDTPDYSRNLFTLDDKANNMVNFAFQKYWEDGLIYKGAYLVNWSVGLQTAVSDMAGEIEYSTRIDPFVTFEYEVKEFKVNNAKFKTPHFQTFLHDFLLPLNLWPRLQLSTVRPETKFTDLAVAMHPSKLEIYFNENLFDNLKPGFDPNLAKEFITAIKDYEIEIFYHLPALKSGELKLILTEKVDPNFGTGILKVTPAHDQFDYDLYKEFSEKGILESGKIQTSIGRDGKLTEVCGEFAGLTVEQGRLAVMKRLAETGYIPVKKEFENEKIQILAEIAQNLSQENFDPTDYSYEEGIKRLQQIMGEAGSKLEINWNYEHNVTICERSKTVIEPLISEEFFLDYTKSIKQNNQTTTLQKLGLEGVNEVEYFSSDYKNRAINFVENIKNWCISRDLTWGHRFPVWYNLDVNPEKRFYSAFEIQNLKSKNENLKLVNSPSSHEGVAEQSEDGVGLNKLPFNPKLKEKAKTLRNSGNLAETIFWNHIKNKQLLNLDFDRQKIIGDYIVDFYCTKLNLVIEIDGQSHDLKGKYDIERENYLKSLGLDILHFNDKDQILNNFDETIQNLHDYLLSKLPRQTASATPSQGKGEFHPSSDSEIVHAKNSFSLLPIKIQPYKPTEPGNWVQEEKILDTWFSSCLWPLSTLGLVQNKGVKVVIIHGSPDTKRDYKISDRHWFPTLKSDLEKLGAEVFTPEMPNSEKPIYEEWKTTLENLPITIDENTILIGHSAGGAFLVRYLNEKQTSIKQLVLVSASSTVQDESSRLHHLSNFEIDSSIQTLQIPTVVITSKDEPEYRHQNAENYAKIFDTKVTYFDNYGHFTQDDMGKNDFPELLHLLDINTDFTKFYPTSEMVTGGDIFYIWVVRMIILGKYFTGQIPFKKVIINPTVLDEKGRKMSKSLGNGLDPVEAIDKFSSDSLRLGMLSGMIPGRNMKMGGKIADNLMEKYRNFGNKLWNVARFLENQED